MSSWVGSLVVAGLLAPILAAWQSRSADRRRFEHERNLHASGDLIERIEAVLTSLEEFGETCAEMRALYLSLAATEPDKLWPLVIAAEEDTYQRSRVSTSGATDPAVYACASSRIWRTGWRPNRPAIA